jgi:hypothetical protein
MLVQRYIILNEPTTQAIPIQKNKRQSLAPVYTGRISNNFNLHILLAQLNLLFSKVKVRHYYM